MSDWSKGLRGGSTTPRSRSLVANKRYSQQLEESDIAEACDTTPSQRKMTPKSGTTWGQRLNPRCTPSSRPPLPGAAMATAEDGSPVVETSSICSDDVTVTTEESDIKDLPEGDSVQVFVRVRPPTETEKAESGSYSCLQLLGSRKVLVDLKHRPEPYEFNYDWILPETASQLEVFEVAGAPMVDNCMSGYNSSIFAYGQTGAGKTFTMQGTLAGAKAAGGTGDGADQRGLAPRVFEYLFAQIDKQQDEKGHGPLKFTCRCSMLEIYNEVITDLLNPASTNLQIREDIKAGCYVEGLSEEIVQNMEDAMKLMQRGAENRHVGETRLNRESSRSHSVFTCTVERHTRSENGLTNILFSRLNLIDLAGSERIRSGAHGGSGAVGEHFKEACHINKSLTTLGRVIMELVEAQRSGRRGRHVPYRDSRLTFLLQDSLGGNAKTMIIGNISPSSVCAQETLSTLYFVRRAKHIRNKATINIDTRGDVALLQREIVRLNTELDNLRKGFTDPAVQENKELRATLLETQAAEQELQLRIDALTHEAAQHKREAKRMDQKMVYIQSTACQLQQLLFTLMMRMEKYETLNSSCATYARAVAEAENEASQCSQLQDAQALHSEQLAELQERLAAAQADLAAAREELESDKQQLEVAQRAQKRLQQDLEQEKALHETAAAAAAASLAALEQQLGEARNSNTDLHQLLATAAEREAGLQQQLTDATGRLVQESADLVELQARLAAQEEAAAAAAATWDAEAAAAAAAAAAQLAEQQEEAQGLRSALQQAEASLERQRGEAGAAADAAEQQLAAVQEQLAAAQSAATATTAELVEQHAAAQAAAGQQVEELQQQLSAAHKAAAAAAQQHAELLEQQQQEAKAAADQLQQQLVAAEEAVAESKEALDVARMVNADLDRQLQALTEQLSGSSADKGQLQQLLDASKAEAAQQAALLEETQQQVVAVQQQLAAAEEQVQEKGAAMEQQAAAAQQQQEALEGERQALQQQLAEAAASKQQLEQQLSELSAAHQQLQQQQEASSASACDLQQQLDAARAAAAEQQQQLEAEREAHAGCQKELGEVQVALAEEREALSSKASRLAEVEGEVRSLRAQMAEAAAAAAARADQLEGDLAASEAAHRSRQEALRQQITELANTAGTLQQEKEALQDALDSARADLDLARDQLAAASTSSSSLASEVAELKQQVRAAQGKAQEAADAHAAAQGLVMTRDKEVAELRKQVAAAEEAVAAATEEAAMQVRELQTELLEGQEALGAKTFEVAQMKAALEGAQHRLADKTRDLAAQKEEVSKLRAALSRASSTATDKEQQLGEARSALARATAQLEASQAEAAAMRRQIDNERFEMHEKQSDAERRMKQELLREAKARRAFGEIRRIIDWAGFDRTFGAGAASAGGGYAPASSTTPGAAAAAYFADRSPSVDSGVATEDGTPGALGLCGSSGRGGGLSYSSPLHGQPSSSSYGGASPRTQLLQLQQQQQVLGVLEEEPLVSTSPRQHVRRHSRPDMEVVAMQLHPGPMAGHSSSPAPDTSSPTPSHPQQHQPQQQQYQHMMRSPGLAACTSHAIGDSMDQLAMSTDGVLLSVSAEWGVRGGHRREPSRG